jgi:hypothetical protein
MTSIGIDIKVSIRRWLLWLYLGKGVVGWEHDKKIFGMDRAKGKTLQCRKAALLVQRK